MKKQDLILIGAILATALAVLLAVSLLSAEGTEVVIRQNGQEIARYPLSTDATYTLGEGTNILVIRDGKAYISEATCPDGLCIKRGRISRTGQSVVCLPNRLTVTVVGGNADKNGVDIMS